MKHSAASLRLCVRPLAWACSALVLLSSELHADIFQLKNGGQVTGAIVNRGKQGEYMVETANGAVVTLSRRQIADITAQDPADLEYLERSRTLPDTAEAHRELADWCQEHRLTKQQEHHLRRLLELAPDDEAARQKLGYQKHQDQWLTRDEIMAARGMQRYDGEFLTAQSIALLERAKNREQAETEWFRQIRIWVGWLDDRRANEAAELISAVRDPHAAVAIVKLLEREDRQPVRDLLTATLAEIQHPLAVTTLVDFSLNDPDREVRLQCLDYLLRNHQPVSLVPYVSALNDRKYANKIINRAAEALLRIGNPEAISPLIDALVTTHKFKNTDAPRGNMNAAFTPSGGGGIGAGGGGLSMGGNKSKVVKRDIQNLKVRQALVELSGGQDFMFDEKLWRRWFVNEQIGDYVDARRDR